MGEYILILFDCRSGIARCTQVHRHIKLERSNKVSKLSLCVLDSRKTVIHCFHCRVKMLRNVKKGYLGTIGMALRVYAENNEKHM